MPTLRTLLPAALCAALIASGCGADDERDVRETLERYATAIERRDYQTMCDDLLSDELVGNLREVGYPCEIALQRGFADVEKPSISVRSVKIDGNNASAVARTDAANQEPSEDTIRLAKEGGRWKIFDLSSAPS